MIETGRMDGTGLCIPCNSVKAGDGNYNMKYCIDSDRYYCVYCNS